MAAQKASAKKEDFAGQQSLLNKELKEGVFRRVYLLCGEQAYLRLQNRDRLRAALLGDGDEMNVSVYTGMDVTAREIIDEARTLPFFADRRVVVVRYSGFFKKNADELADFLSQAPDTTSFIFVEDEADARLKLYKQISKLGRCVEFTTQSDRYLLQNIGAFLKKQNQRIGQEDAEYFLGVIGTDMGKLMSELEKLSAYAMDRDVITREDIDTICSRNIEDRIFEMIDAVMRRDIHTVMDRYEDLLALKLAPVRIVVMLEKQFLWMLQLKSMSEDAGMHLTDIINTIAFRQEVDEETGEVKRSRGEIGEFQVKKYLQQASHMSSAELQRAVSLCETADEDFKTGRMNDKMATETLLVKLCNGK